MSTISKPRRLRHVGHLLAIATLLSPCIALAGPWEVGSTSPSKQKKVKAEVTWKHTESKDVWARPVLKFAAPLAKDLSYEVAGGYGIIERKNEPTSSGSRDVTAKLKWRFAAETDRRPAFLVEPKFSFATGDEASGVGDGVTTIKTPVRAGKQFGPFRATAEVFYKHGFAHDYTDMIGYGGLLEYAPNPRLTVGVDLLSDRPVHEGSRYHLRGDVAFKCKAGDHVELQGLLGRSVENRRGEPATSVKFVAVYKF